MRWLSASVAIAILLGGGVLPASADGFPSFLPPKPADEPGPVVAALRLTRLLEAQDYFDVYSAGRLISSGDTDEVERALRRAIDAKNNPVAKTLLCAIDWKNASRDAKPDKAEQWCEEATLQGYAPAQVILALILNQSPRHVDPRWGAHWLRLAAQEGDALAVILLGDAYLRGQGVAQDLATGRKLLESVVALKRYDASFARYFLARDDAGNSPDSASASSLLIQAAENGNWLAQDMLADRFSRGDAGIVRNEAEAAKHRHQSFMYLVSDILQWGPAERGDPSRLPSPSFPATQFAPIPSAVLKAAQADPDLQSGYRLVVGDTSGWSSGFARLKMRAEAGNPVAQAMVCGLLFWRGSRDDLPSAWSWCQQSARHGFAPGEFLFGYLQLLVDDPQWHGDSVRWFSRAADQGMADAKTLMASAYARGRSVDADPSLGRQLIAEMTGADTPAGFFAHSIMYRRGIGVPIDQEKNVAYLKQSAEAGYWIAQVEYGVSIEDTSGVRGEWSRGTPWRNRGVISLMEMIMTWQPPAKP